MLKLLCAGFQGMHVDQYDNELLRLAEDLGRRMLPAFDTPTGTEIIITAWHYIRIEMYCFMHFELLLSFSEQFGLGSGIPYGSVNLALGVSDDESQARRASPRATLLSLGCAS